MRRLLALVVLASAIVSADVVVKNGGTSLGPVTAINCGLNTSCSRSGSVATITATSGGGAATDVVCAGTCVSDAEISDVAGAKVTGTVASASVCTAAEFADYLNLVCGAGEYVTCAGTSCSCSTPSGGGGGSANVVEQSVVLSGGSGIFSSTVSASWATATSKVVCGVLGTTADGLTPEAIAAAGLTVSVSDRSAGVGFTVMINSPFGLEGTIRVHCTGA